MPQYLQGPLRKRKEIRGPNHERPPVESNPKNVDEPLQGHHAAETDVRRDLYFMRAPFAPRLFAWISATLTGRQAHVGPPLFPPAAGIAALPLFGTGEPVPCVLLLLFALELGVL